MGPAQGIFFLGGGKGSGIKTFISGQHMPKFEGREKHFGEQRTQKIIGQQGTKDVVFKWHD